MDEVHIDFGPTTQKFNVGLASVAVPSLARGLTDLHRRYAKLPMNILASPAIDFASRGFVVTPNFEKVIELLWPICQKSSEMAAMFSGKHGRLRAGESFTPYGMVEDLKEFVELGPEFLIEGRLGASLKSMSNSHDEMLLNRSDISIYEVQASELRETGFNGSKIYTACSPSVGGALIHENIKRLNGKSFPADPFGFEQMKMMVDVQREVEKVKGEDSFIRNIIDNANKSLNYKAFTENLIGNTTHISVVDSEGMAAGLTSSLGETCGLVVKGSQLILNNFLGESDVAPREATQRAGGRLVTMCSPSIMENDKGTYVLGSGGSSRIPTAVLHGIVYLQAHGLSVRDAVAAPRLHKQYRGINVEMDGRKDTELQRLIDCSEEEVKVFHGPNMYFGGLHVAANEGGVFVGVGDARRSGASGIC